MFVIGKFIEAIATILNIVLNIYLIIIVARAVISWVNPDPNNQIVRFLHNVTEPVLYQIRKRIPVVFSGVDLSPIIVFLAIIFLQTALVDNLYMFAASLCGK